MKIDRQKLLDTLTNEKVHAPKLHAAMREVGWVESAVILNALAGTESDYDLEAVGDDGDSLGLWQVNTPTWAKLWPGSYPPANWETLGVQLGMVGPVWRSTATTITRARTLFGVTAFPVETEASIANLAWQ